MADASIALKMSSFVRIRLNFQRSLPLPRLQNCWFLFDTATCSTIADLEYLIKERFGGSSKRERSSLEVVNLYLDDYLLPSQEKIEIIQQNDNIRVELEQISKEYSDEDEKSYKGTTSKKVKRNQRICVLPGNRNKLKEKLKSISSSPSTCTSSVGTHSKSDEISKEKNRVISLKNKTNNAPDKQLAKSVTGKRKSNVESTLKSNIKKSKSCANGMGDFHVGNDVDESESSSESSSSTDSSSESESSTQSAPSLPHSNRNGIKTTDSKAKGKNSEHSVHKPKNKSIPQIKGNKGVATNAVTSKSSSVLHDKRKGKSVAKALPSSSSTTLLPSTVAHEPGETQEAESGLKKAAKNKHASRTLNEKEFVKTGRHKARNSHTNLKIMSSSTSPSSSSSSSSSLSENEEDSCLLKMYKKADTLLYPLSSSSSLPSSSVSSPAPGSKQGNKTVSCVSQPVHNVNEKKKHTEKANILQRSSTCLNSTSGSGHIRFDSEDDTPEELEESGLVKNITFDLGTVCSSPYDQNLTASALNDQTSSISTDEQQQPSRRDYSLCIPLHGPPRSKDKIAFKVLELSESYTPEVSDYKEGTVLSYDPVSGTVNIELTKESLKKTRGDGNVSRKFELNYDENEEMTGNEESDPVVVVQWSSMLDAVLISH